MFQVYSKVIQLYICVCVYIYIFFFRFFSIIGYYKILNLAPCAIVGPCCLSLRCFSDNKKKQKSPRGLVDIAHQRHDLRDTSHFSHPDATTWKACPYQLG